MMLKFNIILLEKIKDNDRFIKRIGYEIDR